MAEKLQGIDLSVHNTVTNWKAIKNSGKSFVFLRLGWANSNGTITKDTKFDEYYKNALSVGLDIGVYVFSYLKDVIYAKIAAQNTIKLIKDLVITMPIAFDYENADISKTLTKEQNTTICKTYLSEIQANKYFAMFYTYTSFIQSYINISELSGYALWIADYREKTGTVCPYKGTWGIWQYQGDSGRCTGVNNACDLNIAVVDYASVIKKQGLNNYKINSNNITVVNTTTQNSNIAVSKYLIDYQNEQKSQIIEYDYLTQGNLNLSPHFKISEFKCPTTNTILIDNRLIWILERLYKDLNLGKCIITSGYRTPQYSVSVGGYATDFHTKGMAFDATFWDKKGKQIDSKLVCCKLCDYGDVFGIGYIGGAVHCDSRNKSQIWFGDETNGNSLIKLGYTCFQDYWNINSDGTPRVTYNLTAVKNNLTEDQANQLKTKLVALGISNVDIKKV